MTTIVDLYCRVSTDEQEENTSLDEQEACGRQYCADNGLIVGMVHREIFTGYQYRERKKLSLMRERYREGHIQGVVVRTIDRLSRHQAHIAILMEEMDEAEVTLYGVKEPIDKSPMGKFVIAALALVAEMEREKILDRTLTGRLRAAEAGKVVSGIKPPYGWQWTYDEAGNKDHIILHEDQAKVLQQCAEEYGNGISIYRIIGRLEAEGVAPPKGERWHPKTLRRTLTDPRMTGQNVQIFTNKAKRYKKHLDPVDLPDGTYPRILSDEEYQRVLDRATTNAQLATRNSRTPEKFLLRAGFAKCVYCKHVMTTKTITNGSAREYPVYNCPNRQCDSRFFTVPADKLDSEVWAAASLLADHVALLEEAIELAIANHSLEDDLKATEAAISEWRQRIANYEEDLQDTSLRGDTRRGIRNLLDNAYAMIEQLEADRAELLVFAVDRDREREEYEKILRWCRKVKTEREELDYQTKRDFLRLIGAIVMVERLEKPRVGGPISWDITVRLPQIETIIYQSREIAGHTCRNRRL